MSCCQASSCRTSPTDDGIGQRIAGGSATSGEAVFLYGWSSVRRVLLVAFVGLQSRRQLMECTNIWYTPHSKQENTMSRNTSVSLGPHFASFIDGLVQGGRYGTTSDVVRAGLRLLEEHEARVKALQDALREGMASGEPRPFDFEDFKARKRAGFQQQ